jgi:c-di-GMP-binding flagellar brake protein YcgR
MARHHKSRFLAITESELWVESVPTEFVLLDEIIRSQQPLAIDFKAGESNVTFSVRIHAREPNYRLNAQDTVTLEALRLERPAALKVVQRRSHYRVKTRGSEISARVWRISRSAPPGTRLPSETELTTEIQDLSLGGMGVIFQGKGGQPPKVTDGEYVRAELRSPCGVLVLDGLVRCPPMANQVGTKRAGIQWTAAEKSLEGRQMLAQLAKILGGIEREELRRVRLGMAG